MSLENQHETVTIPTRESSFPNYLKKVKQAAAACFSLGLLWYGLNLLDYGIQAQAEESAVLPINSCQEITSSGDYLLTQDILADRANCINIHDTENINFDCQNHSVGATYDPDTGAGIALNVKDVKNFSINNCSSIAAGRTDRYKYQNPSSIEITNSSFGRIQNNKIGTGPVMVRDSNNLQFADNIVNAFYWQAQSSSNTISNNKFKVDRYVADVVGLYGGGKNTVENNVIDGGWDGKNESIYLIGADNGMMLTWEFEDLISGNTISNNFCSGIETSGFTRDTKIINNKINNVGLNGIGGWYYHNWLNNTVDSNVIDGAAYMFYMFRYNPLGQDEQIMYFKDNTFTNNTFLRQKDSSYIGPTGNFSSKIDFQNLPNGVSESQVQFGNNTFKNNDFNKTLLSPILIPTSMIIDQGGNQCLATTDILERPLQCVSTSNLTPTITLTPGFENTVTSTPIATATKTATSSSTVVRATATFSPTPSETPTASPIPKDTVTSTPKPTEISTPVATRTATSSSTATFEATISTTPSKTPTPFRTPTSEPSRPSGGQPYQIYLPSIH